MPNVSAKIVDAASNDLFKSQCPKDAKEASLSLAAYMVSPVWWLQAPPPQVLQAPGTGMVLPKPDIKQSSKGSHAAPLQLT